MKFTTLIVFMFLITVPVWAQLSSYDYVVSQDGSGDFVTVQEALDAVPDIRNHVTRILIKNGIYKEKLVLSGSKTNVFLIGEDKMRTVLTHDDYADKLNQFGERIGTSGSSSFYIYGDGFRAQNITFENSSGPVGQAVAVRVDADQVVFDNCRFLGFQDTLYPHGKNSRQYYRQCYIEGTTDFIFGWSTAVFEDCEIFSKKGGQYITAASTEQGQSFGFVFLNCHLTGDAPSGTVYLGRPWRDYAKTVYVNCEMDQHIHSQGWHNWGKTHAETTAYYAEYQSTGIGANTNNRANWTHQLTDAQAKDYELTKIFDGWNPNEEKSVEP
ncbi:pectinesterase family protein [Reichenbachiella agarivorans]|uniref:Pectinesterase n=1 Tax=Reichenbachiella agarivorans TaxID=2979464 RepID=A0ABY6CPC2_9BACT|nr:pectinesterase family protein [Reichenbachiella agarivorans]UXP32379.1 pectinesterase family protein [Reichenbachiella agarivorans]